MSPRRIRLVTQYSFPAFLRNGSGVSYVVVTIILGLLTAESLLSLYESGLVPLKELVEFLETSLSTLLAVASLRGSFAQVGELQEQGLLDTYGEWAVYLLQSQPALLSGVFALQLIVVPLFIASGAFNQLSGDLQYGAVRYQLLRVTRAELFLGRFLGMAIFTWALISSLLISLVVYFGLKIDLYTWGEILPWGARAVFAFGVLSLPYVALCSLISANVSSPFGSLVLSSLAVVVVPSLAVWLISIWKPLGNLIYLLPWGVQHRLFHPDLSQVALAGLACLGYTAVYLAIGYFFFRKRDL